VWRCLRQTKVISANGLSKPLRSGVSLVSKSLRKFMSDRKLVALSAIMAALVVASACSSSGSAHSAGGSGGGNGLTGTIRVISIRDQTGAIAYSALPAIKGSQLAIDEINQSHFLGSATVQMAVKDPASNGQTAASIVTAALASKNYSAILGPLYGPEALVVAPAAEKAKVPVVFTEANVDGVILGDYTWRATAPTLGYYGIMGKYLKSKGVKTLGVIYDASTLTELDIFKLEQQIFEKNYGIKIVSATSVQQTTQDFSAPVTKVLADHPDAMAINVVGPANGTATRQLRQAGFEGPVIGSQAAGSGNMTGAGQLGKGMTWPTTFSALQNIASAKKFVTDYQTKFGAVPNNFAAEGYDAMWFLARAMLRAHSSSPTAIAQGLATVARQGFAGAEGQIGFKDQSMTISPILLQWDGSKETLIPNPS
jgi:branched-chain amino acid transport system substrate-binding protein